MSAHALPANLLTLREALPVAERGGYALGSFSPRYVAMIRPTLLAAERARAPLIVQISANEFRRYGVTPEQFADEFYRQLAEARITVPVEFLLQRDDEHVARHSGLALFDAFSSKEKTLHANAGGHVEVPRFEVDSATRFLARRLGRAGTSPA